MENIENSNIPLNLTYLKEMVGDNAEFIIEILDVFTDQTPIFMKDMETALAIEDWAKVGDMAHKIKPTLTYIGRDDLKDYAHDLEYKARNLISLESLPYQVALFKQYLEEVYEQIFKTKAILLAN
jgi:HPt (histidine-containing phosphotransfer) domain-containing protein